MSDSIITNALKAVDPVVKAKVRNRMFIAVKIADLLEEKEMTRSELAEKMDKQPSVVTRWLSGDHNFTMDILTEIGIALDYNFITQERIEKKVVNNYKLARKSTRSRVEQLSPLFTILQPKLQYSLRCR